ncbi:hypothetical protein PV10_01134 [Exophiala mesophila]|uniref:Uncharacterized protein n=1 Tax=Exophiala mesophila TaxID=212818 RepID=A0A0D1Y9P3_EXOME|nr:uncharacterized protein PV10_01134 [Exophiala mesophila]KIV97376.1 hypothetical protein PV10_01134 [Exophiala mesophila]
MVLVDTRGTIDSSSAQDQHLQDGDVSPDQEPPTTVDDPTSSHSVSRLDTNTIWDDGVIGISISRQQTHMRSPETPIAEKARALNLAPEYLQSIDSVVEVDGDDGHDESDPVLQILQSPSEEPGVLPDAHHVPLSQKTNSDLPLDASVERMDPEREAGTVDDTGVSSSSQPQPPTPWRSDAVVEGQSSAQYLPTNIRQSLTRSFLGNAGEGGRRRASSGPTAIFNNLRKLLPDIPSPSINRSSLSIALSSTRKPGSDPTTAATTPPERNRPWWSIKDASERDPLDTKHAKVLPEHPSSPLLRQLDGNVESLLEPKSPQSIRSLVRSNSEGSLYIGRRISGVSAYDDTTAFADVSEMVNSRFKAITDSLQNSTLKLPKMPTMRPSPKRHLTPEQAQHYSYTTLKNLRLSNKAIDVETPQQRAHPKLAHALSKLTGDVVILGGYRGSVLRSAKPPHRQLWVPIKVGLNLRKVDLEVGLSREDEENMEQTIIPSGILSHIGPIDICRRLLKHLEKCPNTRQNKLRVHNWGYDWRLSPDLLSKRLITFLEGLECNRADTPRHQRGATIIAHSLGGLITRHAVNQRPDLFAGVVYAGTPQNCVNILGPMRNGDDVLLSSRVLTAQVNFTIRTSFALLPDDGHCFIQKHTNEKYPLDFFDPRVWEEYHLSPCIKAPLCRNSSNGDRRKSLIGQLSDSLPSRPSWLNGQISQPNDSKPAVEGQGSVQSAQNALNENAEEMVGPSLKSAQNSKPNIATTVTIPNEAAKEYLARVLAEIKAFRQQLKFIPSHQEDNLYPPHGFIFGKTVPTVHSARVADMESIKYDDAFDDLAFAAGDGVVLASAAQLPAGYRCVKGGRHESDRGHVGLLGDLETVGACLEAVIDARQKGVGLGKSFSAAGNE